MEENTQEVYTYTVSYKDLDNKFDNFFIRAVDLKEAIDKFIKEVKDLNCLRDFTINRDDQKVKIIY